MNYRVSHEESRRRYLDSYDAEEAARYNAWIDTLTSEDHEACLADIQKIVPLTGPLDVLDCGAGTGALSLALCRLTNLKITALEPCPEMLSLLQCRPELAKVQCVSGFCDHPADRSQFAAETFDVIASRQLLNSLYDPLAAFENWSYWLRSGGRVVITDGLFNRDAWTGVWSWAVDELPLATTRSLATVPYLLENAGFEIEYAGRAVETNKLPSSRTERYLVIAKKR